MRGMFYPLPVRKSTKREVGPKLHRRTDTGRILPCRVNYCVTGPFGYFGIVSKIQKGCGDIRCKDSVLRLFALILTMSRVNSASP